MRYTPFSEEDVKATHIIEAGTYEFQVDEVITVNSYGHAMTDKNGNEMCKLKLLVNDADGNERVVYTYISGDDRFAYKLRHFAKTIGMLAQYEAGSLQVTESVGRRGQAQIIIKKGTPKNDGSGDVWPDRNDVKDFVGEGTSSSSAIADEDLPF